MATDNPQVIIFDTTLRDGELTPEVTMDPQDKLEIALLLEKIGVAVIDEAIISVH